MLRIIKTRFSQKYRTMSFPNGPAPELPERFAGRPVISDNCVSGCNNCQSNCPTGAITFSNENECPAIDTGKCIFCRACQTACPSNNIQFGPDYRLAAISRNNLIISNNPPVPEISGTGWLPSCFQDRSNSGRYLLVVAMPVKPTAMYLVHRPGTWAV